MSPSIAGGSANEPAQRVRWRQSGQGSRPEAHDQGREKGEKRQRDCYWGGRSCDGGLAILVPDQVREATD